jgi:hypothetical protein
MQVGDKEYSWVSRHTWQSWRERYKKNSARLDPKIAEIVERNKPLPGDKGQYGYVRKPEEKVKKTKKKSAEADDSTIPGPSKDELDFLSQTLIMPPSALLAAIPGINAPTSTIHSSMLPPTGSHSIASSSVTISPEVLAARQNASEEEDDESEWQIREGTGPAPLWAKRKAPTDDDSGQNPQKRIRQMSQYVFCHLLSSQLHPEFAMMIL